MSALDDARAVLRLCEVDVGQPIPGVYQVHEALAALVAECESERAQLGELLVRAVEACPGGVWIKPYLPDDWMVKEVAGGARMGNGDTLPDALRALLAKVEGA